MKITTTKQFSAYLKDIRWDENLYQTDVANNVNIRQDTVSSFDLRSYSTKIEASFKLLSVLKLDIESTLRTDNNNDWQEE